MKDMADAELLREFAERKSEQALGLLVSRYSGLVYSIALRRLGNVQLAQDVTQSVFLLLPRKAERIK
jgi:RNA polymerase sigma-70 factor, ECF subfamily